ncbi:uncharacterized protein LOC143415147 isoform X2 [Maylandia zebra]|uniref:uncharacterized protein LOC143415147 isoform X2 n=1 Tax=Maylandia zebra TaxID=106582 RepID=UPI00403C8CA4
MTLICNREMADADATTDLCWIHHEETTDIKLHVKNRSVTTVPRLEFFLLTQTDLGPEPQDVLQGCWESDFCVLNYDSKKALLGERKAQPVSCTVEDLKRLVVQKEVQFRAPIGNGFKKSLPYIGL